MLLFFYIYDSDYILNNYYSLNYGVLALLSFLCCNFYLILLIIYFYFYTPDTDHLLLFN